MALLSSWALAVIAFVPASNLLFVVGFEVAERVLYLPSIGFCLLAAYALLALATRTRLSGATAKAVGAGLVVGVAALYGARVLSRVPDWTTEKTLWASTLRALPGNAKAHFNFGNELMKEGRFAEGLEWYRKANAIDPGTYDLDVGIALYKLERTHEAIEFFQRATKRRRSAERGFEALAKAHAHLAQLATVRGNVSDSLRLLGEARALFGRSLESALEDKAQLLVDALTKQLAFADELPAPSEPLRADLAKTDKRQQSLGFLERARKLLKNGSLAEALTLCDAAVVLWPDNLEAWVAGGDILVAYGQNALRSPGAAAGNSHEMAATWFNLARSRHPEDLRLALSHAKSLLFASNRRRAVEVLLPYLRRPQHRTLELFNTLAVALRDLGFTTQARRAALAIDLFRHHDEVVRTVDATVSGIRAAAAAAATTATSGGSPRRAP